MANLNIGASLANVTTLAGLPVDKGTIYATISAPSTISLATAMYQGQIMNVVINPTANMILPMPTATGWYTTFGDTLTLIKGTKTLLTIYCNGNGLYTIQCSQKDPTNGYDYVDLGLPSGLLWATCNVGASQPHEYGKYFQWGATVGYYSGTTEAANHSSWATCPWKENETPTMTQLDAAHDAARVNMGGEWRMPTSADTKELYDYTTNSWTSVSGVNGRRFTSKSNSSNSIFIPAAGKYYSGSFNHAGNYGYVWSSSLYPSNTYYAYTLRFHNSLVFPQDNYGRYHGFSIRGVLG